MAQGKGWLFTMSCVGILAFGCGGSNGTQYAEAAVGLGATVGATGIYRAQTHGCWANCSPGYGCDRASGLCHRVECVPACPSNQTCFIEVDDSFRCIDVLGAGKLGATTPAPTMSSAPVSSPAAPISSASPN
ncbi:MAG TPA: hypothetical protein VER12_15115 [Polyangiaceae bacterium]|nr:hypothetical protein [Polyangiaceae bacterium]